MGRGVFPVTPVYEDMHAKTIYEEAKKNINQYATTKVPKQPENLMWCMCGVCVCVCYVTIRPVVLFEGVSSS